MEHRQEIYAEIEKERAYQDEKWGTAFDDTAQSCGLVDIRLVVLCACIAVMADFKGGAERV